MSVGRFDMPIDASAHPLSEEEFWTIYRKVPRLTVEIIVISEKGFYLTLRQIEPCKGLWHLPGGTVRFGERLLDAVSRVARRELGIEVEHAAMKGYIEYPSHFLCGLDSPVGIAFQISFSGEITPNEEAAKGGWFEVLPDNMHDEQKEFLRRLTT